MSTFGETILQIRLAQPVRREAHSFRTAVKAQKTLAWGVCGEIARQLGLSAETVVKEQFPQVFSMTAAPGKAFTKFRIAGELCKRVNYSGKNTGLQNALKNDWKKQTEKKVKGHS